MTDELSKLIKNEFSQLKKTLCLQDNALLTAYELAEMYNIDRKMVYKILDSGDIPFVYKGQSSKAPRVVRKKDFDIYIQNIFSNKFRENEFFTRGA